MTHQTEDDRNDRRIALEYAVRRSEGYGTGEDITAEAEMFRAFLAGEATPTSEGTEQ